MFKCEQCGCESHYIEIEVFDRSGGDYWEKFYVTEHENGYYVDVPFNWAGYEFDDDDDDKRGCIRCRHCHKFPFKDKEIQTYGYERVVMFATKENE